MRVVPASESRFTLAQPAERIRIKQVLDALRGTDSEEEERLAMARVGPAASRLWRELDQVVTESSANKLLSEAVADSQNERQADRVHSASG